MIVLTVAQLASPPAKYPRCAAAAAPMTSQMTSRIAPMLLVLRLRPTTMDLGYPTGDSCIPVAGAGATARPAEFAHLSQPPRGPPTEPAPALIGPLRDTLRATARLGHVLRERRM